jgi:hypothetical protein
MIKYFSAANVGVYTLTQSFFFEKNVSFKLSLQRIDTLAAISKVD